MAIPTPITDVFALEARRSYAFHVHSGGQEYHVSWCGDWREPPDLTCFPQIYDATITPIAHSPEVDEIWAKSHVVCYGQDSHIRKLDGWKGMTFRPAKSPWMNVKGVSRA